MSTKDGLLTKIICFDAIEETPALDDIDCWEAADEFIGVIGLRYAEKAAIQFFKEEGDPYLESVAVAFRTGDTVERYDVDITVDVSASASKVEAYES